jgi:hypothetical protein
VTGRAHSPNCVVHPFWHISAFQSSCSSNMIRSLIPHNSVPSLVTFTRRVVRTAQVLLVQSVCNRCGFTAIAPKRTIETIEAKHERHCTRERTHHSDA